MCVCMCVCVWVQSQYTHTHTHTNRLCTPPVTETLAKKKKTWSRYERSRSFKATEARHVTLTCANRT